MSTVQVDGDAVINVELVDESPVIDVTIQGSGPRGAQGPQGPAGYSPTVSVVDITGGHRITITDATGPHTFDVMDGQDGGGGGGTSDYEDLDNLPSINGVELIGDGSTEDYHLDQVVWVTYGSSSYNEISSLAADDKAVLCWYNSHVYWLTGLSTAQLQIAEFTTKMGAGVDGWLKCTGSTWTNGTVRSAPEEVTVSTAGDVTHALDAGKIYHFTGALTSLTLTLTAAPSGNAAQYHFDFASGSTAPTVTLPQTVTMPSGFQVEANKHYEIDILDGYGVAQSW